MSHKIVSTIDLLRDNILRKPDKFFFNEAAAAMDILEFEVELGVDLPFSYKIFLNNFDGGFVADTYQSKMIIKDGNIEGARWNSNHIFSLNEIREIYEDRSAKNWKLFDTRLDIYPFIPFCRTSIGELLIFAIPLDEKFESPVFDAFHEEFPSSWGKLYDNFSELFEHYVKNDGQIKTTSYDPPTADDFINRG